MVIFMFYFLSGIVIGLILTASSIYLLMTKKNDLVSNLIYLGCGLGYIGTGIGGFFINKDLEFIIILLLTLFSAIAVLWYYVFNKKINTPRVR